MSSLQGKDILVIDDAEDVRLLAKKILENDGANVYTAADINSGIELAVMKEPHLIILDLQFPEKGGFDFLETRRNSSQLTKIPVMVLSAKRDKNTISEAITLNVQDYLLKPFRATQLLQKTRKQLRVASFSAFKFQEGEEPAVQVAVPGEILKLSEVGFKIESYAKLESNKPVEVKSEFFDKFPIGDAMIKTSARPAFNATPGRYQSTLFFTGIGEAFVKKLRKALSA